MLSLYGKHSEKVRIYIEISHLFCPRGKLRSAVGAHVACCMVVGVGAFVQAT